jgi:FAD/FMN-containing dehydrogenase
VTSERSLITYEKAAEALDCCLRGRILRPGDAGYDEAALIHNAAHQRHPALIVRAACAGDVITAVNFAREYGLTVAVRSGAHSVPGHSSTDGMVIDLTAMRGLEVDPERRIVRVEPGFTWGEVSERLQEFGLAIPAGDTATVGVGGLTTGGGIGWLARKYGLTIDSLISAEVVTADGRLLRVSAEENADLFWAIRGGGGNFGIVTSFEFRAHPVDMIIGGAVIYDAEEGQQVLRRYADYAASAPDELTTIVFMMHAPPLPFLPPESVGKPIILIGVCYAGDLDKGQDVVAPLRELGTPIADITGPMPYPAIYALTAEAGVKGHHAAVRSLFINELSDDAIETMLGQLRSLSSPFGLLQLRVLGGAVSRVPADATAFPHRHQPYWLTLINLWMDPSESARHQAFADAFLRAVQRYADGVYVNFLDDEGETRVRAAYGPDTYARLAILKARYDPTNFFHLNQNVRPAHVEERAA